MWRQLICPRIKCFQSGIFSLRWLNQLFTFEAFPEVDLLSFSHTTQWQRCYTFETPLPLGAWVECFQPSLDVSGKLCVSSCTSSYSSVQVSGRTCQRSTQTFDSGDTMLDGGSFASHSSQHVGGCSSALSHHKRSHCGCFCRPCAQGSAISAFYLLSAQYVCYIDRGSFPQSVRWWWGQLKCLH